MSNSTPRALRPYQEEAAAAVEYAWMSGKPRASVVLPTGTGKAEPVDNVIPTPDGIRRFGDLAVGDHVYGVHGNPIKVLSIHPQGVREVFRLTFSDGTSTLADGDHLWCVTNGERSQASTETVMTTKELMSEGLLDTRTNTFRFHIPMASPTSGSSAVPSVQDRVHRLTELFSRNGHSRKSWGYKFIGPITDSSEELQRIVWSLGGTAVIKPPRMEVTFPYSVLKAVELMEIMDRVTYPPENACDYPRRSIIDIEPAGSAECQCITVDDPTHLYLTGHAHIVTHNSTVIASVATRARANGQRALLLAHRTELLDQMAEAVKAVDPSIDRVGVVAADRDEYDTDIVAASFQTLARSPKRLAALGKRDVILADECHHISAPTYLRVLEDLGAMDDTSGVNSCGFTATMYRDDGKSLGDVWTDVVFEKDLVWAIENGFLIKPKGKTVAIPGLNKLASIKNVGGDYKQSDLDDVMGASVDSTVDAILRHCPKSAMIVFAVSVEHARVLAEKLTAIGIPSKDVTGSHKREYREEAYAEFRDSRINCLVTVQVLTEGADFPRCDTVVLARPTRSKVLFTQIVGRSVRLYTDPVTGMAKSDATVLDLTGVVRDMKLASLTDLFPDADQQVFDSSGKDRSDDEDFMDEFLSRPPKKERQGRLELEDIDIMGTVHRRVVWLRTGPLNTSHDEVTFMPLKHPGEYVFIYPPINRIGNDPVALGHLNRHGVVSFLRDSSGAVVRGKLTDAMDGAEKVVGPKNYIRNDAGWRRPGIAPSDRQIELARNLGIAGADTRSRGDLSDRISEVFAAQMFRDVVRRYPYTPV